MVNKYVKNDELTYITWAFVIHLFAFCVRDFFYGFILLNFLLSFTNFLCLIFQWKMKILFSWSLYFCKVHFKIQLLNDFILVPDVKLVCVHCAHVSCLVKTKFTHQVKKNSSSSMHLAHPAGICETKQLSYRCIIKHLSNLGTVFIELTQAHQWSNITTHEAIWIRA